MLKVGVFGGAFNPVHNGHVNLATECMNLLKLDKMLIVPTSVSPHKQRANISYEHRENMCRLAFEGMDKFEICDIETGFSGKSYTINTIRALKQQYPSDTRFYLIIGGDMLYYFPKWYRYEALLGECQVVAAARENDDYVDMMEFANKIGRIKVLNLPVVEVSSTDIRQKLEAGENPDGLVPQAVLDYINEKGLYKHE